MIEYMLLVCSLILEMRTAIIYIGIIIISVLVYAYILYN